jgi:hypothetical protein
MISPSKLPKERVPKSHRKKRQLSKGNIDKQVIQA